MTVCIGALCEDGKSVVVAADKMVTFGTPMNLQTEPPDLKKIVKLTKKSVLLFSGSVPDGEEILVSAQSKLSNNPKQTTAKIAEAVKDAYADLKKKRVEETILKPLLGADFPKFQTLVSQSASSQILQQVLGLISQHNLQAELLVAGTDDAGAHLFIVSHPGILLPVETTGYAAVGSGGLHAGISLSLAQHSKVLPLVDAIYNVYEAKKSAEVAPGVGKLTDMAIVTATEVIFAKDPLFDTLEKAHKERPTVTASEHAELKKACDDWIKPTV